MTATNLLGNQNLVAHQLLKLCWITVKAMWQIHRNGERNVYIYIYTPSRCGSDVSQLQSLLARICSISNVGLS